MNDSTGAPIIVGALYWLPNQDPAKEPEIVIALSAPAPRYLMRHDTVIVFWNDATEVAPFRGKNSLGNVAGAYPVGDANPAKDYSARAKVLRALSKKQCKACGGKYFAP